MRRASPGVMEHDLETDATGLRCPLPVLRARKLLQGMAPGSVLKVLADDPMAEIDLPHFCAEAGHEMIKTRAEGPARAYLIRKGG